MRLSKIAALLIVLILIAGMGTAIAAENSSENFTEIRTVEDFDRIRNNLSGNYKLMNDLAFNETNLKGWKSIDNEEGFMGCFDGNGKTIYNFSASSEEGSGFFGIIEKNGSVKNLTFENALVSGNERAGILSGVNNGKIENCHSLNSESIAHMWAGGLVGLNIQGEIINCSSSGTVSSEHAGGLVGSNTDGKIKNCTSSAEVNGKFIAGGITAENMNDNSEIVNCYSEGTIKSTGFAGGIAGTNYGGKIEYCYSTSRLPEKSQVAGGIAGAGKDFSSEVSNCVSINEEINGIRRISFEKDSETDRFPKLKLKGRSYTGKVMGSTEHTPIDCFAWDQIETNKFRLNGDSVNITERTEIWNTFPNGVWSGWDEEVWEIGVDGLPSLKWQKSENPNAI
jgi:The GLUG motif.